MQREKEEKYATKEQYGQFSCFLSFYSYVFRIPQSDWKCSYCGLYNAHDNSVCSLCGKKELPATLGRSRKPNLEDDNDNNNNINARLQVNNNINLYRSSSFQPTLSTKRASVSVVESSRHNRSSSVNETSSKIYIRASTFTLILNNSFILECDSTRYLFLVVKKVLDPFGM